MAELINIVVQGVLLGGLFALFALGLSLVFGVMRVVNIAHGDVIVLLAYLGLVICTSLHINPFLALPLVVIIAAASGWLMQRYFFVHVKRQDPLVPLLVAFGFSIIIQNSLLLQFGADPRKLDAGPIEQWSIEPVAGLHVGVFSLLIFAVAVGTIAVLQMLIYKTGFGRFIRAVADSEGNAVTVGIETKAVFAKAFALVMAITALAAVFMAIKSNFDPAAGPSRLLTGFEAVVIGGLGNLWGTLAGGIVIGLAQMIGASIDASWQVMAGHIVFLITLIFRPHGLFPKLNG